MTLAAAALIGLLAVPRTGTCAAEPPHQTVTLSFLYPLGTNQNPNIATDIEISILYGRVGSIGGVDLNGGVSLVGRDVRGFQATGIYSQVGGWFHGAQITGAFNTVASEFHGLQLAGVGNVDRGSVHGVLAAGLFNAAESTLCGAQIAGLYNNAGGPGRVLQLAGFANSVGGDFHGWQLAGGFNFTAGTLSGMQLGGVNMAVSAHGAQVGLANLSREAAGLQVGALNLTGEERGLPVGLVNVAKNGTMDWIAYYSGLSAVNVGVRTSVRRFYSVLVAGAPDLEPSAVPFTFVLTWNYGYTVYAGRKTSVGLDLGFSHFIPTEVGETSDENDRLHFALQARALLERHLGPNWSAFIGGGAAKIYSEYSLAAPAETQGLFVAGISHR